MESVGFKEWAIVCAALGRGEQSVILRKGGIAEGRDGFSFRHTKFFLFPTCFHEQVERTRLVAPEFPSGRAGEIEIRFRAEVEASAVVTSWETAVALEPLHILRREVVRERFEYDGAPQVHVAFVRVFRLSAPWIIPDLPRYGGCRSWVNLPEVPADLILEPVVSDEAHRQRGEQLKATLTDDLGSGLLARPFGSPPKSWWR